MSVQPRIYVKGEILNGCKFVSEIERSPSGARRGTFICHCGKEFPSFISNLKSGNAGGCGCLRGKKGHVKGERNPNYRNGSRNHREYRSWASMKSRCKSKTNPIYGGRGITFCERWSKYESFIEDMGLMPGPGYYSIDRIDPNGNYEPANCRWATRQVQNRNRTNHHNLTIKGVTKPMFAWAEESGTSYANILYRVRNGWPHEAAVFEPLHKNQSTPFQKSYPSPI